MAEGLEGLPDVPGVTHRMVSSGALRLHLAEAGEGAPVLLLHGWPQHWYMWRALIGPLAEHHHVLCPDLRGMGWSDTPREGYEKEQLALDVLGLLDTLGLERVVLVGHDWGAWVGFLLCLRAPERVRRFLALDAPHPFQRADLRRLAGLWRLWYQLVIATPGVGASALRQGGFQELVLRRAVGPAFAWDEQVLSTFVSRVREPERARASVALYRTFVLRELPSLVAGRYRSARLRVPTRLVAGEHDPAVRPETLAGGARYADELEVEIVPGCGHFIVDERPDLVLERAQALIRVSE